MVYHMNVFRILGDVSHTLSIFILIWAIHRNRSAEGVSLLTQGFYLLVFLARYLNLFWVPPQYSWWNFVLKITFITTSAYIVFLMMQVYRRTREREKAWKLGSYILGGSIVLAPFVAMIMKKDAKAVLTFELPWTFSIILESVCVLPQLLLLRQTDVPTVISSYYLLLLGSYRAFYILNWIVRAATEKGEFNEKTAAIFGIIQTALYFDFAWVYYTRQRVKLRGGGLVDSDDLRKGWLLSKILGHKTLQGDEEEGADGDLSRDRERPLEGRWGARGISVSADDTLNEHVPDKKPAGPQSKAKVTEADGAREEELAGILEDDESDDGVLPEVTGSGISGGQEWRDGVSR